MLLGQKQTGETVNATLSMNPNTGAYIYTFNDPFDMLLDLNNVSGGVVVRDGNSNNRLNLMNATGLVIEGGNGNDIYNVSATAGGLLDNVIHGGAGDDFITMGGSNIGVDLTQGSTGIEAVVAHAGLTGESVTLKLSQLLGSALTDGGSGRAFAAVLGSTGQVNLTETGTFHFVGVVDPAGNGFDASGNAITGDALTSLLSSVTQIDSIKGNLASIWAGLPNGTVPSHETHIADTLDAYVFSNGTKSYTVWSDGVVTPTDTKGNVQAAIYQPAPAIPAQPTVYGAIAVFDRTGDWAGANLSTDQNGVDHLSVNDGSTSATAAISLKALVTGTIVHGDSGANGSDWFGLGDSGGLNHIFGGPNGNIFDLQQSTALQDILTGGAGFDVVRAPAAGTDVNLTANNAITAHASSSIDAVVGSANLQNVQTVELDVTKLAYSPDSSGIKSAVFEAMLGSSADALTLSGSGKWVELTTFAPGASLPANASPLVDPDVLDGLFGSHQHTAENSLTGYLFEQVNSLGDPVKYVTIYTDAMVDNLLAPGLHLSASAAPSDQLI